MQRVKKRNAFHLAQKKIDLSRAERDDKIYHVTIKKKKHLYSCTSYSVIYFVVQQMALFTAIFLWFGKFIGEVSVTGI